MRIRTLQGDAKQPRKAVRMSIEEDMIYKNMFLLSHAGIIGAYKVISFETVFLCLGKYRKICYNGRR